MRRWEKRLIENGERTPELHGKQRNPVVSRKSIAWRHTSVPRTCSTPFICGSSGSCVLFRTLDGSHLVCVPNGIPKAPFAEPEWKSKLPCWLRVSRPSMLQSDEPEFCRLKPPDLIKLRRLGDGRVDRDRDRRPFTRLPTETASSIRRSDKMAFRCSLAGQFRKPYLASTLFGLYCWERHRIEKPISPRLEVRRWDLPPGAVAHDAVSCRPEAVFDA
jgi:hypothetical protein